MNEKTFQLTIQIIKIRYDISPRCLAHGSHDVTLTNFSDFNRMYLENYSSDYYQISLRTISAIHICYIQISAQTVKK